MNDALLELGRDVDLANVSLDLTAVTPWPAAFVWTSDLIPIADLGGVACGTEKAYLHISVTEDFAEASPPCVVTWYLVSVASAATFATEVLTPAYNIHWTSGPTLASSGYAANQRPVVAPLPPLRNYKAALGVFATMSTGLSAGRVNVRIVTDIDSNKINPFPNAI